MPRPTSPHIVVIGAGTLGLSCAINLSEQGARVTVLDAGAIASGSSGRSVGVIGTQYSDAFDIKLRVHALRQFRHWETLGLNFQRIGYLRLARTADQMALLAQSVELQDSAGFKSHLHEAGELKKIVPHLSTQGLAGGILGPDDGFIDAHQMCSLLAQMVRESGGTVRQFCRLLDVTRTGGGYRLGVSDDIIRCDMVVNAAGAWAPAVAAMLGQTLHIHPERHEAVTIHLDHPLAYTMPMVMDLVNGQGTGLNFRHEAPTALIAEIHKVDTSSPEDPDAYNDQCNEDSKVALAELLLDRLPDLPGARLGRGWAGLYPVTADDRPFVGPVDPSEPTVITAAGAGGYGIQLAPVIGQLAADWVMQGAPNSMPEAEVLTPNQERNLPRV
ncbi:FAD-binding oxidoreductase [Roseovarius aestuarii]|nr:FAD-binding oxidoreductase [Roseovarius aestuarii]